MKIDIHKLNKLKSKFDSEIRKTELSLSKFLDFEISICFQNSDASFMVTDDDGNTAPLQCCINEIAESGKISRSKFLSFCI